ncbi:MAG TPA: aldo/keto reductase [Xanthobacteraceae bacterium]|nr:aldo/keto reductase [Xanthobacteraceae bacterium]
MIARVRLAPHGVEVSRVGFGTSRLHHLRSRKERQDILAEAADLGICHFDTAPMYGDGLAEHELGHFLRRRRDGYVVATKFGIEPSFLIEAAPALAWPMRGTRALLRRAGLWADRRPPLTSSRLRRSLDGSLNRLGTDHVDILLLHEGNLARIPDPDDLSGELERLRIEGKIRSYGIAAAFPTARAVAAAHPALAAILQTGEHEWDAAAAITPDITFGAISAGRTQGLMRDHGVSSDLAARHLRAALARRPHGAVLVSTTSRTHLRELARAAAAP